MTVDQLEEIVARLDKEYERDGGAIHFSYNEQAVSIYTDSEADRMRIIIPIIKAEDLTAELAVRIMQANFDSTLDARYALGQGVLWSTFLHSLSSLTEEDFLSGIGQTINITTTFGTTFSSGMFTFGGGDSNDILQKELLEELLRQGQAT